MNGAPAGRVLIVLTLMDEGRIKPLDEVQLIIPSDEKDDAGHQYLDFVASLEMAKTDDGKRVTRLHLTKALAKRAQLHLNTHAMDGKADPLTRLEHVIPIADYMKDIAR